MVNDTKQSKESNVSIDALILKAIPKLHKANATHPSTYQIAKDVSISWSTANIHCLQLKSKDKIDGEEVCAAVGSGKKMVWWLK